MHEKQFEHELEVFRTEYEAATQHFCAYLKIHRAASEHPRFHAFLNRTPLWWNTCLAALQASSIITIGRIFDQSTPHNIDTLIRTAQSNATTLFSKASLEARILGRGQGGDRPLWLDGILADAYTPTVEDFRKIRGLIRDQRKIYESNYRELRHQVFAHKVASQPEEITALFAKTNIGELERLLEFLAALYKQLWSLYFNGRTLTLDHLANVKGDEIGRYITQQIQSFVDYILEFGRPAGSFSGGE